MEPFKSCDKRLVLSVVDSGSTGTTATKAFLRSYNNMTTRPHIMVGTARSAAAMPTAVVSGIYDVPMITYWATSAKLDDMGEYPRFMRTIPTDDAVSFSVIQYWKGLGYTHAAMMFVNDAYGEAYKESLVKHGAAEGIAVKAFPFNPEDDAGIHKSIDTMKESGLNIVMAVAFTTGFFKIAEYATKVGMMGKGRMWMFSEAILSSDFDGLSPIAKQAVHGSMRVLAAGAIEGNAAWTAMAGKLKTMTPSSFNPHYPSYFKVDKTEEADFATAMDSKSGPLRDIGTYVKERALGCARARAVYDTVQIYYTVHVQFHIRPHYSNGSFSPPLNTAPPRFLPRASKYTQVRV